ncbi:MAG: hypothetical protein JWQ10_395 [Herbaspirillum sp.]|jgi:hypothetical protein|nr:hypothetical protein [Herbaspirillum sp.]
MEQNTKTKQPEPRPYNQNGNVGFIGYILSLDKKMKAQKLAK